MIEILLLLLIFGIIIVAFPYCFYRCLNEEDFEASLRWMWATLGCLGATMLLGMAGTLIYGA